jgi:hypothetical protein
MPKIKLERALVQAKWQEECAGAMGLKGQEREMGKIMKNSLLLLSFD